MADDSKPLSEAVLWILLSLSDRPRHGYALMQEIADASDGRVRVSTGTLYGAIRRLAEYEWIEAVELADTSREKQSYKLTPAGRAQLRKELERLSHIRRSAAARLRPKGV
jgi:DNA-binding PadR family transcriptional regulator